MGKTIEELCVYRVIVPKSSGGKIVAGSRVELRLDDGTLIRLPNLVAVSIEHSAGEIPRATITVLGAFTEGE